MGFGKVDNIMPLSDRDYIKGEHPPTCTCVRCCQSRLWGVRTQEIIPASVLIKPPKPTDQPQKILIAIVIVFIIIVCIIAVIYLFPDMFSEMFIEVESLISHMIQNTK